jgi:hypothetical protein
MSTFMDERCITIWTAPSGKRHVEGWFGEALCGKWIDKSAWRYFDLTSLRYLGRIGRNPSGYCKVCASNYKDVDIDAY